VAGVAGESLCFLVAQANRLMVAAVWNLFVPCEASI